ncbi:MAG: hypothetical protein IJR49_00660 [Treponema sp.]|nr:hypothetical protein [Treponema sp.]
MTTIEKFRRDALRILGRAKDKKAHELKKEYADVMKLFIHAAPKCGELPKSLAEYWFESINYGLGASVKDFKSEEEQQIERNIDKACAFLAFLDDSFSEEDESFISDDDWYEIGKRVSYESDDLPITVLSSLMSRLLEKGAL